MLESAETLDTGHKTILVVEDSTTQALHLQALLEQEGLKVELARDGRAGLQMAQQLQPDLIVLDVQMPEMNGFQVCRQLKDARSTASWPSCACPTTCNPGTVSIILASICRTTVESSTTSTRMVSFMTR